ncbi:MAG: hypothetical protein JNL01_16555 [Bdellovibrionales bacterium]|nr:hypothetical protein [Bdellovibrionales bacterium]
MKNALFPILFFTASTLAHAEDRTYKLYQGPSIGAEFGSLRLDCISVFNALGIHPGTSYSLIACTEAGWQQNAEKFNGAQEVSVQEYLKSFESDLNAEIEKIYDAVYRKYTAQEANIRYVTSSSERGDAFGLNYTGETESKDDLNYYRRRLAALSTLTGDALEQAMLKIQRMIARYEQRYDQLYGSTGKKSAFIPVDQLLNALMLPTTIENAFHPGFRQDFSRTVLWNSHGILKKIFAEPIKDTFPYRALMKSTNYMATRTYLIEESVVRSQFLTQQHRARFVDLHDKLTGLSCRDNLSN